MPAKWMFGHSKRNLLELRGVQDYLQIILITSNLPIATLILLHGLMHEILFIHERSERRKRKGDEDEDE